MATIRTTVKEITNEFIMTDKGTLYYYVVYVNEEFNIGDVILSPTDLKYYESLGRSSWYVGSLGDVYMTEFDGDFIKGVATRNTSGNLIAYQLQLFDEGKVLVTFTAYPGTKNYLGSFAYMFVSPNGVATFCSGLNSNSPFTGFKTSINPFNVLPTENEIGTFKLEDANVTPMNFNVNVTEDGVKYATIVKNGSFGPGPSDTDPFNPGGTTGDGTGGGTGGTGDFDGTSDPIDFPSLPTLSAVSTGFITLFTPTQTQMNDLANYMWGDLFDINTWKKVFSDPMDAILGLSIVPVTVPTSGTFEVTVGNIGTGVSMNRASSQYVSVDCGILNVNEFWGAYLDYSPYTKAEIFLPYIGTHSIDVDDIMGKPVHVKYSVDILSGAVSAFIKCGDSVLYEFTGQCSCSIPITGNDWTNVINGAINIAASVGTMVASGGLSAPMAISGGASIAGNALSMKPSIERSGAINGMGAMLGNQTPYLILTRPRQALPPKQNEFIGYPSFITAQIGTLSGYTEFEEVHMQGMTATQEEVNEIERLLKSGVIC